MEQVYYLSNSSHAARWSYCKKYCYVADKRYDKNQVLIESTRISLNNRY
jgi:hypothetical protein